MTFFGCGRVFSERLISKQAIFRWLELGKLGKLMYDVGRWPVSRRGRCEVIESCLLVKFIMFKENVSDYQKIVQEYEPSCIKMDG